MQARADVLAPRLLHLSSLAMKIFVRGLAGQEASPMEVEEEITVAALKRAIHESEQLGVGVSLSLILGHRKLDVDNLSLAEAGIEEGTTVIAIKHQLPAV